MKEQPVAIEPEVAIPVVQPVEPLISSFADNAYETHSHESNHERNHEHSEAAIEAAVEPDDKAPAMNFTEIENKDYVMPALSLLKQPKKRIKVVNIN